MLEIASVSNALVSKLPGKPFVFFFHIIAELFHQKNLWTGCRGCKTGIDTPATSSVSSPELGAERFKWAYFCT
jgi:hypothetical protein